MCRIEELCRKDVINVKDGSRLGFVCDVEIDVCTGHVVSLVIFGRSKFLCFGREEDIIIPWNCIQTIGDDTILVCFEIPCRHHCKPRSSFWSFFK